MYLFYEAAIVFGVLRKPSQRARSLHLLIMPTPSAGSTHEDRGFTLDPFQRDGIAAP